VVRKSLTELSPTELSVIRSDTIRGRLDHYLEEQGWNELSRDEQKKKLPELLAAFGQKNNIKRVRILVKNQTAIPIKSAPYKAYVPDSYVCCDIWALPKGKPGRWQKGKELWQGQFWNYAECAAGVPDKNKKKPHPAARFVMRLFKDDMVSFFENGQEQTMRVAGFSTTNNKLDIKPHNLSDAPRQFFSINKLGENGLRQVYISPDGCCLNPRKK